MVDPPLMSAPVMNPPVVNPPVTVISALKGLTLDTSEGRFQTVSFGRFVWDDSSEAKDLGYLWRCLRLRHGTRVCEEQRTFIFHNSFVCDEQPEYAKSFVSDESSEGNSRIWVSDVSRVSPSVMNSFRDLFLRRGQGLFVWA